MIIEFEKGYSPDAIELGLGVKREYKVGQLEQDKVTIGLPKYVVIRKAGFTLRLLNWTFFFGFITERSFNTKQEVLKHLK